MAELRAGRIGGPDRPPIDRLETDVHKAMSAVRREWCAATDALALATSEAKSLEAEHIVLNGRIEALQGELSAVQHDVLGFCERDRSRETAMLHELRRMAEAAEARALASAAAREEEAAICRLQRVELEAAKEALEEAERQKHESVEAQRKLVEALHTQRKLEAEEHMKRISALTTKIDAFSDDASSATIGQPGHLNPRPERPRLSHGARLRCESLCGQLWRLSEPDAKLEPRTRLCAPDRKANGVSAGD